MQVCLWTEIGVDWINLCLTQQCGKYLGRRLNKLTPTSSGWLTDCGLTVMGCIMRGWRSQCWKGRRETCLARLILSAPISEVFQSPWQIAANTAAISRWPGNWSSGSHQQSMAKLCWCCPWAPLPHSRLTPHHQFATNQASVDQGRWRRGS